jgi:hypothetical protein
MGSVFMIPNLATSDDSKLRAFRDCKSASVRDAWQRLDPEYWRHGLTISQGLGWSVSGDQATRRLIYIRVRLLKAMFGNNFRRKSAKIKFLVFRQGSRKRFNQHFHVLMAIEGDHGWSDQKIAEAIYAIDRKRSKRHWEKDVHVDWDWIKGSRFHSYVAREAVFNADSVLVL